MKFRADIQAMRGLAVLMVLLYHAGWLPGGYLGVDVFFVISGFVVTGMLRRAMASGSFSLRDFYIRRARRLLPAAYVTFLGCTAAAPFFLTESDTRDYAAQLAGALTFTANIVLWRQSGYFEAAAHVKPLLHTWSLAIEEQFYLLLPAAMLMLPARRWLTVGAAVTLASFLLWAILAPTKPGATFYLLPTRAWELGLGVVAALVSTSPRLAAVARAGFWPALASLAAAAMLPGSGQDSVWRIVVACAAASVILLRQHELFDRPSTRPLAGLGDMSYSLYLVHWPVFAFAANAWVSEVPTVVRIGLLGLSFVLALALYRLVERPVHRWPAKPSTGQVAVGLTATAALMIAAGALWTQAAQPQAATWASRMQSNTGLSDACEFDDRVDLRPACATDRNPRVLLWGDSVAMHLAGAVIQSPGVQMLQATKSFCGPTVGLAPVGPAPYGESWARSCLAFNDSVLAHVAATPSIEMVVLSTWGKQYSDFPQIRTSAGSSAGEGPAGEMGRLAFEESLARTVRELRKLGKRVVMVAPPPASKFDVGRCHELLATGRQVFGADTPDCRIDRFAFERQAAGQIASLESVSRKESVAVFRFEPALCGASDCITRAGDTVLYRDGGHFSREGSAWIGRELRFHDALLMLAR